MIMIYQIFALALIMGVVWYLGYRRGKTVKERELQYMKIMDEILTEDDNDDFFTGNISKSSRTDTNKDERQK